MALDRRTRDRMLRHCGQLHEDDGVDPREYFKTESGRGKPNRKVLQLCSQVAQTLNLVLAGEFDDELLHNLQVESVDPTPDASQLCVSVSCVVADETVDSQEILERLAKVAGRLRSEVATAITRKRAPKLVFRVVSPSQAEGTEP